MIVDVYRNLRPGGGPPCYSIRGPRGRVIGHATAVELRDPVPFVSALGRARVLREGRKNVHAWIRGELAACAPRFPGRGGLGGCRGLPAADLPERPGPEWLALGYNPHKGPEFTIARPAAPGPALDAFLARERDLYGVLDPGEGYDFLPARRLAAAGGRALLTPSGAWLLPAPPPEETRP